jgi:hypothetical protein
MLKNINHCTKYFNMTIRQIYINISFWVFVCLLSLKLPVYK